eukprot:XP_001701733.1 predicted protein [Chlamydomonas reinhardtii]
MSYQHSAAWQALKRITAASQVGKVRSVAWLVWEKLLLPCVHKRVGLPPIDVVQEQQCLLAVEIVVQVISSIDPWACLALLSLQVVVGADVAAMLPSEQLDHALVSNHGPISRKAKRGG